MCFNYFLTLNYFYSFEGISGGWVSTSIRWWCGPCWCGPCCCVVVRSHVGLQSVLSCCALRVGFASPCRVVAVLRVGCPCHGMPCRAVPGLSVRTCPCRATPSLIEGFHVYVAFSKHWIVSARGRAPIQEIHFRNQNLGFLAQGTGHQSRKTTF